MNSAAIPNETETLTISPAEALTPRDVAKRLPFVVSHVTVTRWMREGYKGVILRGVRFGAKRATTQKLVDEFIAQINAQSDEAPPIPRPRMRETAAEKRKRANATAAARRKTHRRADAKLTAQGL